MHRRLVVLALLLALAPLPALAGPLGLPAETILGEDSSSSTFMAGVGTADMTWHVGAGAGQYAAKRFEGDGVPADPHQHSTTQVESYGVHSRLTARAIVVQGTNGNRVALVKTDNYLAQDLLIRRVGQVLAELGSTISHDEILHAASHNHSSPYYSSPAAGVWIFQDVWDVRAFEYQARQIAAAIKNAEDNLKPARMGAATVSVPDLKSNIAGRDTTRDGSPRGYPDDFGDDDIAIVRFDDISDPEDPKPLGTWMNYGQHPESLDGYNLITADFLAPLERLVDNETGSTLVFSQGDVGSAEGPYEGRVKVDDEDGNTILPDGTIKAWAHSGYAQAERFSRILADAVIAGWKEAGTSEAPVPFTTDVPVAMFDGWVPGPVSHPYPSANACRTEDTIEAQPGVGTAAECSRGPKMTDQFDMVAENLREHGIPVPENYDMPSHMAVEENVRLHLQAVRLGEVLLASCACEAQVDLILNIETRTDKLQNNIWRGYDWSERDCVQTAAGPWTCVVGGRTVSGVPDAAIKKMKAQVNNNALGWDDPLYAPYANAEPHDIGEIKGNFTHAELSPELGYALTVGIGHAGDYNGYTVSYREYMAYDHYRKALTSYGPHTADYMATRLMRMAEALKGGRPYNPYTDEPLGAMAQADEARQTALATTIGQIASGAYDGYDATVTPDLGAPAVIAQPQSITRFDAAHVTWVGGNNWVDNPTVRVERKVPVDRPGKGKGRDKGRGKGEAAVPTKWVTYAIQQGEIPVMVHYPATRAGSQEWRWTAAFEAFDGGPNPSLGQTPEGTYRFVIEGTQRVGIENVPYVLESSEFTVTRWAGIGQSKSELPLTIETNGSVSAPATFAYPKTYSSPFAAIRDDGHDNVKRPCKTCTFRPWDAIGEVKSLVVTVVRADGATERIEAQRIGDRFVAATQLNAGDSAFVAPGDVIDTWGETNAQTLETTR